ncbi:MAG TPA: putative sulfate/molybdate transporter [Thermomicrobiales bacterium]|nr:putative sulfate/molybdate transporter [Thermomicrobiales bacterium]
MGVGPGEGVESAPANGVVGRRWAWAEVSGALGDIGVLIPIILVLVVQNGMSSTPLLIAAGLMYLVVSVCYDVAIPVQPMKAASALAIASALSVDVITAAGFLVALIFFSLSATKLLNQVARIIPAPVIRGVQFSVGLALLKIAHGLTFTESSVFSVQPGGWTGLALGTAMVIALFKWPIVSLPVAVGVGVVWASVSAGAPQSVGVSTISAPDWSAQSFLVAFVVLVLPQVPLTVASSCIATADAAAHYYGPTARKVTPNRLGGTIGIGNLASSLIGGMPMCHGSGGVTAHYRFGARHSTAPVIIGVLLIGVGLVFGAEFASYASSVPTPVLASLLAVAGLSHLFLVSKVEGRRGQAVAVALGLATLFVSLTYVLLSALACYWLTRLFRARL